MVKKVHYLTFILIYLFPILIYGELSDISISEFSEIEKTDQISQYGITWLFSERVEFGVFVNGDYWVKGPVTITSVIPTPKEENGNYINGSMINPKIGDNGYDSRTITFNSSLSVDFPQNITTDTSLVSTISVDSSQTTAKPSLEVAAVLTILQDSPDKGSFRPAIIGDTKTIYNYDNIKWDLLPSLPATPSIPSVQTITDEYLKYLIRPRILHTYGWKAWYTNPIQNYPGYHRNNALILSHSAVLCITDWGTLEERKNFVKHYIQVAIDYYGMQQDGGNGVLANYRWITIFGGILLNDNNMRDIWLNNNFGTRGYDDGKLYYWPERRRTILSNVIPSGETWTGSNVFWRVSDVGGNNDSEHDSLHPSEWDIGVGYITDPSNSGYKQETYRLMHSQQIVGFALSALAFNAKSYYNFNVTFDYMNRWMSETKALLVSKGDNYPTHYYSPQTSSSPFVDEMWFQYANTY